MLRRISVWVAYELGGGLRATGRNSLSAHLTGHVLINELSGQGRAFC